MFILIIIYLILIIFFLWLIETKFNLLYQAKTWLDTEFKRRREQTKLKIDIYKIIILVIVSSFIAYVCHLLLGKLYLPYFENVLDLQREGISLKPLESGDATLISDWLTFSNFTNDALKSSEENTSSRIGDWGTFGDFIGGTLNPILTFISICLILYTVYQNKKSLDFNSEELSLSRKAQENSASAQSMIQQTQSLQQFDSFFFSLLNQIRSYELDIQKDDNLKKIYKLLFIQSHSANFNAITELEKKYELNSYFLSLFELVKNIYERVEINEIIETREKITNDYIMILKAMMPFELQQIAMLKIHNSKEYRKYFVHFKFFENTPIYMLDRDNGRISPLVLSLIFSFKNLHLEDKAGKGLDIFGSSVFLKEIRDSLIFNKFFNYSNFMEVCLNGNGIIRELFRVSKFVVIFRWHDDEFRELVIEPDNSGVNIVFRRPTFKVFESKVLYKDVEIYSNFYLIRVNQFIIKAEYQNDLKFYILFMADHDYMEMKSLRIIN